jgi:hypothetical protein
MARLEILIANLQKKGYSYSQILSELQKQGFKHDEIVAALRAETVPILKKTIVSWSKKGYSKEQIQKYLLSYGYHQEEIDSAFPKSYAKPVIGVTGVLVLVVIILFFTLRAPANPTELLDVTTNALDSNVQSGNALEFTVDLTNFGGTRRFDVFVTHVVRGTAITKTETIAVETSTTKKSFIDIPSTVASGNYVLDTTMSYNDQEAVSSFSFTVAEEQVDAPVICVENWDCEPFPQECPESGVIERSCVDTNVCGTTIAKPEMTSYCVGEAVEANVTAGVIVAPEVTVESISVIARKNVTQAMDLCSQAFNKDGCYTDIAISVNDAIYCSGLSDTSNCLATLAKTSGDFTLCAAIRDVRDHDVCYIEFAQEGKVSCDELISLDMKRNCIELTSK